MSNQLLQLEGISDEKAALLIDHFTGFYDVAADWKAKAEAIKVTNTDQVAEMKMARTGRLFLKDKRVAIEKLRKKLKEESFREGQAIDRVARELKGLIEPIEAYLESQEKYAEIKEAERLQALRNERTPVLLELGYQLSAGDPSSYTEEEYLQLIDSLKAINAARMEVERVEQERQERERRVADAARERERRELTELRIKQAEQEKKDREAELQRQQLEKELRDKQAEIERMQKEREAEQIRATRPTEEDRTEALKILDGVFGNPMDFEANIGFSNHDPNNQEPEPVAQSDTKLMGILYGDINTHAGGSMAYAVLNIPPVNNGRMERIRHVLELLIDLDRVEIQACDSDRWERQTTKQAIEGIDHGVLYGLTISIDI